MIPFSAVARATTGSRVVATDGSKITGSMTVARSRGLGSSTNNAVLTPRAPTAGNFDAGQLVASAPDLRIDLEARIDVPIRLDLRTTTRARVALIPSHFGHAAEPGVSQQQAPLLGRFDPCAQQAVSLCAF